MRFYPSHIFSGLIKCKECGSFMTPVHTNKKHKGKRRQYYYYRCTSTLKKDWDSCSTRQISAKRLDTYILDNLERISLDRQYIDSLVFSLNNGRESGRIGIFESSKNPQDYEVSDNQAGLELSEDTPAISSEIAAQTLQHFVQSLKSCPKIQRNLLVKKFIKNIIYSPSQIQINLYISKDSGNSDFSFSGGGKQKNREKIHQEFSPSKPDSLVRGSIHGSPRSSIRNTASSGNWSLSFLKLLGKS
jgi:hypothetical protein